MAAEIGRSVSRGRNVLMLGERGSGRTSTLSLVEADLAGRERFEVCRVDAAASDDVGDLVAVVLAGLGADPRQPGPRTVTRDELMTRIPGDFLHDRKEVVPVPFNETDVACLVDVARSNGEGGRRQLVVLIDNLPADAGWALFGRFRDALWAAPVVWVAAGTADQEGYVRPPADVFWERVVWLDPLGRDDVEMLLRLRMDEASADDPDVEVVEAAFEKLVELHDAPTPREVIRAAAAVADSGSVDAAFGAVDRYDQARAVGGRSAAVLLETLQGLGRPVHAGDEELLDRIGLTRSRVVQLLRELDNADLVTGRREGRRILYEVRA